MSLRRMIIAVILGLLVVANFAIMTWMGLTLSDMSTDLTQEKILRATDRALATEALRQYRYNQDFAAFDDPEWFSKIHQAGNIEVAFSPSGEVAVIRFPFPDKETREFFDGRANFMRLSMAKDYWFSSYSWKIGKEDKSLSSFFARQTSLPQP